MNGRNLTNQIPPARSRLAFRDRPAYKLTVIAVFAVLAVSGFFVGNAAGSMQISLPRVLEVLFENDGSTERMIIWNVRLPRVILASLVGINLALSGAILQGVMGNPLADPGVIGISSGAGLFGIFILVVLPQYQALVPVAAFVGAMLAATVIYLLAWKGGIQPIRVILSGAAVSAMFSAGISATLVFYSDRVAGALDFMNGSLSARSWGDVRTVLPYTCVGLLAALFLARRMNVLVLGDEVARGLGLHVERTRLLFTVLAALLAASAVSAVGLLGFVGLIVPHTVRLLIGGDCRYGFPASALLGAALVTFSDTFARTVMRPTEIPVGIVMAILGAPFFLYLLRR